MSRKLPLLFTAALLLAAPVSHAALETLSQKTGYALGSDLGTNIKRQGAEIDIDAFIAGFKDAIEGKDLALTREQMNEAIAEFQKGMQAKMAERMADESKVNAAAAEAYLKENAAKKGVITLPSGLQYEVVEEGKGAQPGATNEVTVHYTGTLIDGTIFDSSESRGEPATFRVNEVIKGWTEGLQLMKEGAKYRLYIPAALGYGERGAGGVIGPNAALIFDVQLISVK